MKMSSWNTQALATRTPSMAPASCSTTFTVTSDRCPARMVRTLASASAAPAGRTRVTWIIEEVRKHN